jgi:Phosphotransferase enzyme family
MNRTDANAWIRRHIDPVGEIELARERPWSTVLRVPVDGGVAWFKACAPVQAFEPRLSAELSARWGDRVGEVLAHDEERAWLLLADAGRALVEIGNPPEVWLAALPPYAELQRGEAAHARVHLAHGVPDLRDETLPGRYDELLRSDLPLSPAEIEALRRFAPEFGELCDRLASLELPATVQHDDLHHGNLFLSGDELRVVDWGDSSIASPFFSLVVTFRFLDEQNGLPPDDPWYARLRDAYLEPWGPGLTDGFSLALRVGAFAHTFAWVRQRKHLGVGELPDDDRWFAVVLRRAVARIAG